jgi:hypothetical protein
MWFVFLPMESSLTFFLVIDVAALVFATIGPLEDAVAFHFVVGPGTFVYSSIRPVVDAYEKRAKGDMKNKDLQPSLISSCYSRWPKIFYFRADV